MVTQQMIAPPTPTAMFVTFVVEKDADLRAVRGLLQDVDRKSVV